MSSDSTPEVLADRTAHDLNAALPAWMREEIRSEFLQAHREQSARGRPRRKILIVGGAGYVGSVVAGHLLDAGYLVRCMDRLLYRNGVAVLPLLRSSAYDFWYGDHGDPDALDAALEGVTDVVLLSGLVGDPITKSHPRESEAINEAGLHRMLDHLRDRGLNRVVFVSTCSNYGLIPEGSLANESTPLNPLSAYARAKVAVERRLLDEVGTTDYPSTILRFATAFGLSSRMRFDLTVNEFAREMHLGRALLVYDPDTWRPYCHTKDFACAIRRVIESNRDRVSGEVFNVGHENNNLTKRMIVDMIMKHVPNAPVSYRDHGGDPRNYRVCFKKIREALQFVPEYDVETGIRELLRALRCHLFDDVDANRSFYGNYEIIY